MYLTLLYQQPSTVVSSSTSFLFFLLLQPSPPPLPVRCRLMKIIKLVPLTGSFSTGQTYQWLCRSHRYTVSLSGEPTGSLTSVHAALSHLEQHYKEPGLKNGARTSVMPVMVEKREQPDRDKCEVHDREYSLDSRERTDYPMDCNGP